MDTVDVAVVVANRPEYTQVCLESLYATAHGVRIRPVIVDNGSRARTRSLIGSWASSYDALADDRKAEIEQPLVINTDTNLGFAAGVNRAIKASNPTRPFLILHNDCMPFAGCIGEMEFVLRNADEDVAVVISRTSYANEGTPCIDEIRRRFSVLKPSPKDRLTTEEVREVISKTFPNGESEVVGPDGLLRKTYPRTSYSPEIASFCTLIKPGMFAEFGMFDEDFAPRGYEDRYWFLPAERIGFICMLANWSFAFHFGNITSDGPGYCFPDVMKINKEKFERKCLERDKRMMISRSGTV